MLLKEMVQGGENAGNFSVSVCGSCVTYVAH